MWSFIISTLHQIFFGNQIKESEFAGYVAQVEKDGNAFIILMEKLVGKNPLGDLVIDVRIIVA